MMLPAVALALPISASVIRQLRASLIDVMDSNYIRTVWAKGAGYRTVVLRHALRNAAIPVTTIFGMQLGHLLGGTVIIEQIFGINGLGSYIVKAVTDRDIPVIQACALVFAVGQIGMSLLVDIAYLVLNPRMRAS
jgi:peptide/nickel transport system permease protein